MDTRIEISTTIKNGLPVIARGTIYRCLPHEYPGCDTIEDIEFFWPSGCPFGPEVDDGDQEDACAKMFERDRECDHGW